MQRHEAGLEPELLCASAWHCLAASQFARCPLCQQQRASISNVMIPVILLQHRGPHSA